MSRPLENLTRDEARQRADLVQDVSYDVLLDLTGDAPTFPSRTITRFRCSAPGSESFIDLTARSVRRITLNGQDLPSELFQGTRVRLPDLEAENELVIEADCAYQHSGAGMHRFVDPSDGEVYLHTQFEPFDAHLVFTCFDQPDIKATFDFAVDAPAGWEIVSNMPATERPDADGRWTFARTPRLSAYVTAIVAGPYQVVTDQHGRIALGLYCRKSMAQHLQAEEMFEVTKQGFTFFEEVFDYPYPISKYDQLLVPEFNFGAMENLGCVTFSEHYLFRSKETDAKYESRANTLLHEMAHMWFGDLVTMRWWDDLWLNESFATFMANLGLVQATRFASAWVTFADEEKGWARYQDQLPSTHPISADVPDVEAVHQNFDGITYAKGASVLRQLVAWVGEEQFLDGCRSYFKKFAFGNATLTDFLGELETASGRQLDGWAEAWLQRAGINTLAARFETDGDTYTSFAVDQTAPDDLPTLRPHRIAIGLYDLADGALTRRHQLELDIVGATTVVDDLVGLPSADFVLVNDDDLTYAKLHLDPRSLDTVTAHLASISDPLARTLAWTAAWEMVRDAQTPARRFVELVRNNVGDESDIGVLETMLARAVSAVELYGDPANAPAQLRALATDARARLETAPGGSDSQLAWARHWITTTREDAGQILGLLDGSTVIDGLDIDTELRWHIVTTLAAIGAIGDDVIAAEFERDPTDVGERHVATAKAARPTEQAKAEAWSRIVDDTELSHTVMKATMRGFQRYHQRELIEPYAPRYFESLGRVWEERQLDVALSIIHSMYPTVLAGDELMRLTQDHLARTDLPGPVRRALLEQQDTVLRATRARALDASA